MRAQLPDFVQYLPELLFYTSFHSKIQELPVPSGTATFAIFAAYNKIPAPDGVPCNADQMCPGVRCVAYQCDAVGRVLDWERRYEAVGLDAKQAIRSLRLQLANGLCTMNNFEGMLETLYELKAEIEASAFAELDLPDIPQSND